jgi:hypothetical protein
MIEPACYVLNALMRSLSILLNQSMFRKPSLPGNAHYTRACEIVDNRTFALRTTELTCVLLKDVQFMQPRNSRERKPKMEKGLTSHVRYVTDEETPKVHAGTCLQQQID